MSRVIAVNGIPFRVPDGAPSEETRELITEVIKAGGPAPDRPVDLRSSEKQIGEFFETSGLTELSDPSTPIADSPVLRKERAEAQRRGTIMATAGVASTLGGLPAVTGLVGRGLAAGSRFIPQGLARIAGSQGSVEFGAGVGGAGVGSATFDTMNEAMRHLGVLSQPTEVPELGPGAIGKRAVKEMAIDAAIGGPLVFGPLAVRQAGRKLLGVTSDDVGRIATLAKKLRVPLGIQDVTESRAVRGVQKVLGRFPFLSGPFKKSGVRKAVGVQAASEDILFEIAPAVSLTDLGVDMAKVARETTRELRRPISAQYNLALQRAADADSVVPAQAYRDAAEEIGALAGAKRPLIEVEEAVGEAIVLTEAELKRPVPEQVRLYARKLTRLKDMSVDQFRSVQRDLSRLADRAQVRGLNDDFADATKLKQAGERALDDIVGPPEVVDGVRKANSEFAELMDFLASPTSRKFGRVDRSIPLGRGPVRPGPQPADKLFGLVYTADSPQAMRDLRRLVGPDLFSKATRSHLGLIFDNATTTTAREGPLTRFLGPSGERVTHMDVPGIRRQLGLDRPNSPQFQALKESLALSGSKVTPQKLAEFLDVAETATALGIPDVSAFIARRATLGGPRAVARAMTLGSAVRGTGRGGAGAGPSLLTSLGVVLGLRKMGRILTSPRELDAVTRALSPRAPAAFRRTVAARLIRLAMQEPGPGILGGPELQTDEPAVLDLREIQRQAARAK